MIHMQLRPGWLWLLAVAWMSFVPDKVLADSEDSPSAPPASAEQLDAPAAPTQKPLKAPGPEPGPMETPRPADAGVLLPPMSVEVFGTEDSLRPPPTEVSGNVVLKLSCPADTQIRINNAETSAHGGYRTYLLAVPPRGTSSYKVEGRLVRGGKPLRYVKEISVMWNETNPSLPLLVFEEPAPIPCYAWAAKRLAAPRAPAPAVE